MKRKIYIFISVFFAVIFYGCCKDAVELGKYPLSDEDLKFLPYTQDQALEFEHSNGYVAKFNVTEATLDWQKSDNGCEECFCPSDYYSFQQKKVNISCEYPFMNMELTLYKNYYFSEGSSFSFSLNNEYYLYLNIGADNNYEIDSTFSFYDTLKIGDKNYYDVVEKSFDNYFLTDTNSMIFKSALFNKTYGLIQIKGYNNETYTLQ